MNPGGALEALSEGLPLLPGGIDMLSGRGGCSRQSWKEIESLKVNRKTR